MITSIDIIFILILSITLDLAFGDPSNRFHPVSWFGKIVKYFIPKLKITKKENQYEEKIRGVVFTISFIVISALLVQVFLIYLKNIDFFMFFILSIYLLYSTIAIKNMDKHVDNIINSLKRNDIDNARLKLSFIVGRDTQKLDEQHILSAAIESIADSTVDGIISPLFYFSFFGPTGAFVFRIINTLDSMIGYRNNYFVNIGWMAAKADTFANYIPARITSLLMIISSIIARADWKNSIKILIRDRNCSISVNSGYPMSAMAGALKIRLEKIDHYVLGNPEEILSIQKCILAIKIMKITTILFCLLISIPTILLLGFLKWWCIVFAF